MGDLKKFIDGVNCINVYSQGYTEIGRFYSNFAHTPFLCEDGYFSSIEAYWYWIKTNGLSPRNTYGQSAKREGKRYASVNNIDEEKIKKAIDIKIKNNIKLIKEKLSFSLPLTHYYDYGNKRVDGGYLWIIEHLEKRREQLNIYFKNKKNEL